MNLKDGLIDYLLRMGDNALILGHRLSEWCGHAPILEQDIAITNIALDFIGQSRMLYQYAATIEGKGRSEDDIAYLRDVTAYRNILLVEQPNEDWAYTIVRQVLYDVYNFYFHSALQKSKDSHIAAYAEKALKEITYHLRWSSEWLVRLGDGTAESHQKAQKALDDYWMYSGEFLIADEVDNMMEEEGIGVDLTEIKIVYYPHLQDIITKATLKIPSDVWMQSGGKKGLHTEHLGYILAEMQYLQRTHPGAEW